MSNQPKLDVHQFAGLEHQHWAVHAEYRGNGEIASTGLSFNDYERMHTETHKAFSSRQIPAPAWALNDDQLRAVLVRYVENRAHLPHGQGTDAERLARAKQVLAARHKRLEVVLDRLLAVYSQVKGHPASAQYFAQKVREADTQLVTGQKIELLLAGVAYRYWRLGENSVEVGAALGILPTLVRQLCWRLRCIAGELGYGPVLVKKRYKDRGHSRTTSLIAPERRLPLVIKLHKRGATVNEIRRELGWATDSRDGYGMVKRLMIQAGLR